MTSPEVVQLVRAVLVEAHDGWQVSDRRYLSEGSMAVLNQPDPTEEVAQPALMASWSNPQKTPQTGQSYTTGRGATSDGCRRACPWCMPPGCRPDATVMRR